MRSSLFVPPAILQVRPAPTTLPMIARCCCSVDIAIRLQPRTANRGWKGSCHQLQFHLDERNRPAVALLRARIADGWEHHRCHRHRSMDVVRCHQSCREWGNDYGDGARRC